MSTFLWSSLLLLSLLLLVRLPMCVYIYIDQASSNHNGLCVSPLSFSRLWNMAGAMSLANASSSLAWPAAQGPRRTWWILGIWTQNGSSKTPKSSKNSDLSNQKWGLGEHRWLMGLKPTINIHKWGYNGDIYICIYVYNGIYNYKL